MKNKLFTFLALTLLSTLNPLHKSAMGRARHSVRADGLPRGNGAHGVTRPTLTLWLLLGLLTSALCLSAQAQSTATPYSGRLSDANGAANGSYDLTFTLFYTNQTGTAMAGPVTNSATVVSNGVFATSVDFGAGAFNSTNSWIELAVRPTGSNVDFTALSPRQAVTPVPVALYALSAGPGNAGLAGTNGVAGANGTNGVAGTAASLAITNTITADYASAASVTNLGTSSSAILQFSIPQGLPGTNGLSGTNGATGPQGLAGIDGTNGTNGLAGTNGTNGVAGTNGVDGTAATVAITNTITANYASPASVTNLGTSSSAILQFSIPQGLPGTNGLSGTNGLAGANGTNGVAGANGVDGTAATVAITNTITANYASPASVTNLGTSSSALLQFSIPQGLPGTNGLSGTNGATGPQGIAGPLLPNVALVDTNQTYTGTNIFNGVVLATNQNNQFSGTFTGGGLGLTNVSAAGVTGTFIASQIPNLDASKIASGTLALGRLPGVVVTNNRGGVTLGGTFFGNLVGNAATATLATNVVSGIRITNATIVGNSSFTGDGAGLTNVTAGVAATATRATSADSATTAINFSGSLSGNVTGTQGATVVATVGGQTAADVASGASAANAATSVNTANTIVKRDASGNFAAGAITASNLSGNGSNLTSLNASNLTSGTIPLARLSGITREQIDPATWQFLIDLITGGIPPPPDMALIPSGSFTMGDTLDGLGDAVPIGVRLSAFYMDTNLVSYSQWTNVKAFATSQGYTFVNAGAGKAANHPVQSVNWYDTVKWCNARSQQAALTPVYYTDAALTAVYTNGQPETLYPDWGAAGYRLPTEAEWEKAARGGLSGQRFPWGNVINQNLANYPGYTAYYSYDLGPDGYNAAFANGVTPYTSPVGSFAANRYGLYDMAGNVNEWCWDWYATPYAGGMNPHGPAVSPNFINGMRVTRGGDWNNGAERARCAARGFNAPFFPNDTIGFRCVRGF